ncbi:MAG: hypothetical protein AAFQ22_03845 [Pseudomonadota bacterium]
MRGLSSTAMSAFAVILSTFTTYLTFFDARYTVSAAVAKVSVQVQSGGGSINGVQNVAYRYFPTATVILSNRGTRPVVVSEIDIVRSSSLESCEPAEAEVFVTEISPIIVEPGTVTSLDLEIQLPRIAAEGPVDTPLQVDDETALWCAAWVAFDPQGYRREPMTPFFTLTRRFDPAGPGDRYPSPRLELDYPRQPETIVSKGLF